MKSQGLSITTIVVIVIGVVVLAAVLLLFFSGIGEAKSPIHSQVNMADCQTIISRIESSNPSKSDITTLAGTYGYCSKDCPKTTLNYIDSDGSIKTCTLSCSGSSASCN